MVYSNKTNKFLIKKKIKKNFHQEIRLEIIRKIFEKSSKI